ncbi:unnamed protein product [Dovyalis caffra]|uniref:Cytochrome P450 n=1 Tax=Dovyalis caffra TaxID=77055 RepID=A0AAV1SU05_9ROSI|nr:unnamed protein product [Dovyalis caffra]
MKMELEFCWMIFTALISVFVATWWLLKRANEWFYVSRLGEKQQALPPGDMGWPLIGNMWSFLIAFKHGNPDSFISSFVTRQILMDDKRFKNGWPKVTHQLLGRRSFVGLSDQEHRRLRKLTAAPINGRKALTIGESDPIIDTLEKLYSDLNCGIRAMTINLPGFAYHEALKARKKLVRILQAILDGRRTRKNGDLSESETHKDMMDMLIEIEDENGKKMDDEEIIDLILVYLNAGHESSAHATMWAVLFLEEHPEYFNQAKAEQEEIVRRRPSTEKGLSFQEIKQMEYLPRVIDETLRVRNISLFTFREAKCDANLGGYIIPQGWKVLVWFRAVHLDSENYPNPNEFNPWRWNAGTIQSKVQVEISTSYEAHRQLPRKNQKNHMKELHKISVDTKHHLDASMDQEIR